MKRNIITMVLLAIFSLVCVSCGGGGDDPVLPDTPNQPEPGGDTPAPVDNTFPDPQWENAVRGIEGTFSGSMTVYLSVPEEATQVAVFCGDECRGVAYKESVADCKSVWIGLVHGNDGDVLTFKYYAAASRFMYRTDATATYKGETAYGDIDNPVQVSFTQVTR